MVQWRRTACVLGGVAGLLAGPPALAQGADLADRYGARPGVLDISISPSGERIALVTPGESMEEMIHVIELGPDGAQRTVAVDSNTNGFITNCDWGSEEYLVCNFRGTEEFGRYRIGFNRLLVVAADGSGVREMDNSRYRSLSYNQSDGSVLLLDVPGKPNSILLQSITGVRKQTGTIAGRGEAGVGVDEIDLRSLASQQVMRPRMESVGYLAGDAGDIRIMGTISRGSGGRIYDDDIEFSYRGSGGSEFHSLEHERDMEDVFYVGVDGENDLAYFTAEKDGYRSLYSITLDQRGTIEELLSRDGYDIDGVLQLGRSNRVVGATFATDRRHYEYFDPELRSLAQDLTDALPGNPLIEFLDASSDERRLLVFAHGDTDPGILYLLDRETLRMDQILPLRSELEGLDHSRVRPVTYAARDGVEIPGYLTLPPGMDDARGLPAIVMPHGGPASRDEWGFDWLAQFFAQSGYAVLQPNFRGSTGYGTAWEMENGFQSWQTAIADVADGGRWLIAEGVADPSKLAVLGWSYGGYAALQASAIESDLFKAVVAIAPVTDLGQLRDDSRNYASYPIISDFLGNGSHIDTGSPARRADEITAPVLLVHGELDEPVPIRHSEIMEDALKDAGRSARLLRFEDLGHSLWEGQARSTMLREAEAFLRASLN
ncbi:alpha/beta hydrolase family protein [Aurantiacibacter hainanensis]|uniref:alpha/beta hydrolase family protein n=1 Tax=Aurantiacibacter hainanensis TaxID=3076114 RepID=UPI0030C72E5B